MLGDFFFLKSFLIMSFDDYFVEIAIMHSIISS